MKMKLIAALATAGFAMCSQVATAYDGTIAFSGAVTATTCVINGGPGKDFTVTLPTVQHTAVDNNQVAGRTPFKIELTSCSAGSNSVHVYFEPIGGTIDSATGYLKNTASSGATNVQISLLNGDASWIDLRGNDGAQNSMAATISNSAATLNYFAQYQGVNNAPVGAGTVASSVIYSLSYQ